MSYKPVTIDTSAECLSPELEELVERLAENSHDHWSLKRMAEGWTYGTQRDDRNKKHPDLKSYSDLPESEKEYDRKTVSETLKAIMALGYEIRLNGQQMRAPEGSGLR